MECIFIRHGIAVDPEKWEGSEEDRPLTQKGKKRVQRAAAGLASMHVTPTHLLSSPFMRSKETAKLIRFQLCPSLQVSTHKELAVGSTPEQVVALLSAQPPESVILCIGHEPLLGHTAGLLLGGKRSLNFPMKKAGACLIHLSGAVKPGHGLLRWWLEPSQLRAMGRGGKIDKNTRRGSD